MSQQNCEFRARGAYLCCNICPRRDTDERMYQMYSLQHALGKLIVDDSRFIGTTMGRLREAQLNTTPSATTHGLSPIVRSAWHHRLRRPRWGTAGYGAEQGRAVRRNAVRHRRPPAQAGPRAAAEAARHIVTKPHQPRTYRDEGCERASVAVGRSMHPAGASTSGRHWPWTQMESRA